MDILKEAYVEKCIISWLENKGYKVPEKYKDTNKKIVDIHAYDKNGNSYLIEVKGETKAIRVDFLNLLTHRICQLTNN